MKGRFIMKETKIILFSVIIALQFMVMQACSQPSKERIMNPVKEISIVPEGEPINQDEVLKDPLPKECILNLPKEFHYPTNQDTIKSLSCNFHLKDRTDFVVSVKTVSGDLYFQIIDVDTDGPVYELTDLQNGSETVTLEPGNYQILIDFADHTGYLDIIQAARLE